ncbi:MAG: DUF488 family protein [Pseudonocardiaceae bacterium]
MTVYSIGHSTHSIDTFVALLKETRVAAIADVRSTPYSRWRPQFNRDALRNSLAERGIAYVFLGTELGGRGTDCSARDQYGRIQYQYIAESAEFREGLRRVRAGSERMRLALMCAESEPLDCHRGILISRLLAAQGMRVLHIHADGQLETHRDAETRLLRLMGLHEWDLLRTEDQILADAYERQESRIAYVMPGGALAEEKAAR